MSERGVFVQIEENVGSAKGALWARLSLAGVGVVILLLIIGAMTPQRTYGDIANEEAAKCIDSGGDDQWSPADGTLANYCQLKGSVAALRLKAQRDGQAEASR
jgi:hypothetical protein